LLYYPFINIINNANKHLEDSLDNNNFIKETPNQESKSKLNKLKDFLSSITQKKQGELVGLASLEKRKISKLLNECLKDYGGEVAARERAAYIGQTYLELDMKGRKDILLMLAGLEYDNSDILKNISLLCKDLDGNNFKEENIYKLKKSLRSPRSTILKQLNFLEPGVFLLVEMRKDLLKFIDDGAKELVSLEEDFANLLNSWFDVGFLELEKITWDSSASLLQKVTMYEAVHKIQSWSDLENRLDADRRFYALFHPRMKNEPLIFVEVALMNKIADSVQEILDESLPTTNPEKANTAIFYSISNTQNGLRGISFGNFLIKKVVVELKNEFPNLKNFVTLSPIPRFVPWLKSQLKNGELEKLIKANVSFQKDPKSLMSENLSVDYLYKDLIEIINNPTTKLNNYNDSYRDKVLKPTLEMLCSVYLTNKNKEWTNDPVLKFHLTNGAEINRINWMGDTSENGMKQSLGLMVNYLYNLKDVEKNHENFDDDIKSISSNIKDMLKKKVIKY
jgi:malonyl-CoA decarboxylase